MLCQGYFSKNRSGDETESMIDLPHFYFLFFEFQCCALPFIYVTISWEEPERSKVVLVVVVAKRDIGVPIICLNIDLFSFCQ